MGPHQVVALHPVSGPATYPSVVRHRIRRDSRGDYLAAAAALNASDVEVVSIQHEYGIWGGDDGAYVLDFVRALDVPVVTTLHTVLRTPTPSQRRILTALVGMSATTVVMSKAAASLLTRAYGVEPGRVRIVPHGVPRLPLVDPDTVKPHLDLDGRLVILSFGLLGPGKGYESAIAAMPAVSRCLPLGALRGPRCHAPGPAAARGRGLPPPARGHGRGPRRHRPRALRRPVRGAHGARDLAGRRRTSS